MAAEVKVPFEPGDVFRIDFLRIGDAWQVTKLIRVHLSSERNPRTIVASFDNKGAGFDIEAALGWCDQHGWTVRRWPGGARAWRNGLEPVRTRGAIQKLRDQLKARPHPELEGHVHTLDLAYDL